MSNLLLMPGAVATNNSNQFEYADYEEISVDQPVTLLWLQITAISLSMLTTKKSL